MKVESVIYGNDLYSARIEIAINGKCEICVGSLSECPEDANLVRDLAFTRDIPGLLKMAYEAGRSGEAFELVERQEEGE